MSFPIFNYYDTVQVMFWISDKETFVAAEEFGHDLEHVEVDKQIELQTDIQIQKIDGHRQIDRKYVNIDRQIEKQIEKLLEKQIEKLIEKQIEKLLEKQIEKLIDKLIDKQIDIQKDRNIDIEK